MRDTRDKRVAQRNAGSILASLLLHALAAYLLFSLVTSSSEQASTESIAGSTVVTVAREVPKKPLPAVHVAMPVQHASLAPRPRSAALPRSAPPHPRVLHELAKFAPTAPPNPTPAPVSSSAPNPVPTQAQLSVTPAPVRPAVPTSAPANIAAVTIPRIAPSPKPVVTAAPSAPPVTPAPQPSAIESTQAPLLAVATPQPLITPGAPARVRVPAPAATPGRASAPSPGPKAPSSPGPRGVARQKSAPVARPVQPLPGTPRPAAQAGGTSRRARSLNARLRSLIPTAAPSASPAATKHYSLVNLKFTPPPEPTPPPSVLAATKYTFTEDIASQHWKVWPLGAAPEEIAVRMYVTSVHRLGPITWCTGWVARLPVPGSRQGYLITSDRDLTPKWIIEENESLVCSGHLEPFTQPASAPPKLERSYSQYYNESVSRDISSVDIRRAVGTARSTGPRSPSERAVNSER